MLWVHLVSLYVISYFIYFMLYYYNKQAVKLRFKYLSSSQQGAESRTVFITDVPEIPMGQPVFRAFQLVQSKFMFFVPRKVRMALENKINYLIDKASGKVEARATLRHKEQEPQGHKHKVRKWFNKHNEYSQLLEEAKPYKKQDLDRVESEEEMFRDAKEDPMRASSKSLNAQSVKSHPEAEADIEENGKRGDDSAMEDGAKDGAKKKKGQGTSRKQFNTIKQIMLKKSDSKSHDDFIKYGINTKLRAREKLFQGMNAKQMVDSEVRSAFPEGVIDDVHLVYDEDELRKVYQQYQQVKTTLEDLLDLYTSYRRRGKKIKRTQVFVAPQIVGAWAVEKYGPLPLKTDSLEYHTELLAQLYDTILEEQKISRERATSSAFLTFKKKWHRTVAVTSLFCQNEQHWRMVSAPNPKEIQWGNLFMQTWERKIRTLIGWGIFVVITLFYSVFASGIQVVIDWLKNLEAAAFIFRNSIMNALVSGIVPQLGLIIFLALVPTLLAIIARMEGIICSSQVDFSVIKKFYLFQIVVVFLGQLIGQNVVGTAQKAIAEPYSIFNTLGGTAPQSGNYFANYIVTQALNTQTLTFMRVVGLVIFLLRTFLASTDRSKRKIWQNYRMFYAYYTVSDMIALMLGLIYSLIQPIVLPMCFVYFLIANVIWRYNLLYVFREEYQSGGLLWPLLHDQVLIAVAIWQIIMVGYFIINQFAASALVVIPLVSTFAYYVVIARSYNRPVKGLSLMGAMQLDKDELKRLLSDSSEYDSAQANFSSDTNIQRGKSTKGNLNQFNQYCADALTSGVTQLDNVLLYILKPFLVDPKEIEQQSIQEYQQNTVRQNIQTKFSADLSKSLYENFTQSQIQVQKGTTSHQQSNKYQHNQSLVHRGQGDEIYQDYDYYYMSPCFKIQHEDHVRQLKEALQMNKLLNGERIEQSDEVNDEYKDMDDIFQGDTDDGPNEPDYYQERDPNFTYKAINYMDARIV